MKKFIMGLCLSIYLMACSNKSDYQKIFNDPFLYSNTVHELNKVVMGNNFSPIVASRNYTYASIAGYEAIAAGYPNEYYSLAKQLNGLESVPQPVNRDKINFHFAALLAYCTLGESVTFPKGSMDGYIDSIKSLARDHGMPSDIYENSISYADTLSRVIMAWSKKDNYNRVKGMPEFTIDYSDSSRWIPTPPAYASAAEPNWNKIRPLVMDSASQFRALPPVAYNIHNKSSAYYKQVQQMLDSTKNLSDSQKNVAEFWDDNPFKLNVHGHMMYATKKFSPPGHWMSIVGIASQKSHADFGTTVYAFAKTSIALFDSFIQCWDEKYRYATARPETIINRSFDPNWRPYLQTPPFPEYTCGHSTGSSSAAEALTSIYGDHFSYTDSSEVEFGIPSRSYRSFREAAMENTWARFYGGLHYHQTCLQSNQYGKSIGDLVATKIKWRKNGKDPGLTLTITSKKSVYAFNQ